MSERLELIFAGDTTRVDSVAAELVDSLRGSHLASERYTLSGGSNQVDAAKAAQAVRERGKNAFLLSSERLQAQYSAVPRFELDMLSLKAVDGSFGTLSGELVQKLHVLGDFVMAWLVDADYDYWQNAKDPLQYDIAGKDHSRLPKVSDGLKPPVGQMIIDTTHNPGRRVLRKGYVEAVGAEMWLAVRFFALTGADGRALEAIPRLRLNRANDAPYLTLSASEELFRSDEGAAAELQRRLRKVLYPEAVLRHDHKLAGSAH